MYHACARYEHACFNKKTYLILTCQKERNTGAVGLASALCAETAVNPEINTLQQHQDPASEGAAALNKQITLDLAVQLASIGADPQLALLSGTFAPGEVRSTLHDSVASPHHPTIVLRQRENTGRRPHWCWQHL